MTYRDAILDTIYELQLQLQYETELEQIDIIELEINELVEALEDL